MHTITGLSAAEVTAKQSAGLTNTVSDSASPSYAWIIVRNIFNLINIFLFPLLLILAYFEKWQEIFVMSTFAIINSLVSMWDEARIKRRLDSIQVQHAKHITVIRDGREQEILATELVISDTVKVREGESIPTDGIVLYADNLQVDESLLTGESNYLVKEKDEEVIGGSFVVTGELVFQATKVGKDAYVNKLGFQSRSFRKEKSELQQIGDKLTVFFVVSSIIFGTLTYLSARDAGYQISDAVIPLVSTVALIVPQTLIFLFTFTFSISVLKLSKLGVLVQRASAVESLAKLDILCFDKTGTITSGDMEVVAEHYWHTDAAEIGKGFRYLATKAFGRNNTFETLAKHFAKHPSYEVSELTQMPFNSKTKVARNQFKLKNKGYIQFIYGASTVVKDYIKPELQSEVMSKVDAGEKAGRRLILGVLRQTDTDHNLEEHFLTDQVWLIELKENLNPGIAETLQRFKELGTELKIISGDSEHAISRILSDLGVEIGAAIDLSKFDGQLESIVGQYSIFARAKPEDKLTIIQTLQAQNKQVGMVGDGVNDVLALKLSNLSIAMQSGAKVAQDVADVVLLNNNFGLVPQIIYEGENVIANLKFMNILFLTKTFHAIAFVLMCMISGLLFPLLPASLLIYGFMATSLPSYAVAFFRRSVTTSTGFWREVLPESILSAVTGAVVSLFIYIDVRNGNDLVFTNTAIMYGTLAFSLLFAIQQLWRGGYLKTWWHPIAIFSVISAISFAASLIPLLNQYYQVANIGFDQWVRGAGFAALGFIVYLLLQRGYLWVRR